MALFISFLPSVHSRKRHHQYLTRDIEHPKLREHLTSVMALMKASSSWNGFMRLLNRALPRYGDTFEIQFDYNENENFKLNNK